MESETNKYPHRRRNPLTDEWVLVSPQRMQRPWQGKQEISILDNRPAFDPSCYLCPGNVRANGAKNPDYLGTYIFTNDFSALHPETPPVQTHSTGLLSEEAVSGICRVICFSPRHDLTLAEMALEDIRTVIDTWAEQARELGQAYRWIQVFENKGELMGCSNPHPHGQIWASNSLPNEPAKEDRQQLIYYQEKKHQLLCDYLAIELAQKQRIIIENDHWVVLVPYWAIWPFETLLLPKRQVLRLYDLSEAERYALAHILKRQLTRYDNLFSVSFPYTMGWHGAPTGAGDYSHWQLHAHFYPPLLRSAQIKKFMVGYEMLSEAQRDITPEQAAEHLRNLSETHYKSLY